MATSIRTLPVRALACAAMLLAAGIAQAGTSSTSMRVGLTLVAPGAAESAPRVDGAINAGGEMAVQGTDTVAIARAVEAAPRIEHVLTSAHADDMRVLAVQF